MSKLTNGAGAFISAEFDVAACALVVDIAATANAIIAVFLMNAFVIILSFVLFSSVCLLLD